MPVSTLATTNQVGLLSPESILGPAETDLEVSRLFVRLLKEGYSIRSRAKGKSMGPLIQPGDLLTVRPTTYVDIRVGDVVVYGSVDDEAEQTLTTHRVVRVVKRGPRPHLLTRDDATGWMGGGAMVVPEQVYGKVITVEQAGHITHLDRPLVALSAWGRIKLIRGIAIVKALIRRILPDRLWRGLQRAARCITQSCKNSRAPGSAGTLQLSPDASLRQSSPLIPWPPNTETRTLLRDIHKTLALDLQVEPHPGILVEQLAEHVLLIPAADRLVDMEAVYALNATGAAVWSMIAAGGRVGDLVEGLAELFVLDSQHAAQDVYRFLADLMAVGAIRLVGGVTDHFTPARCDAGGP